MRFRQRRSDPDWVSLGEASRLLGVTPGTLRRWSDAGRLPAFTTPGGHRRYRRSALERLIPTDRVDRPSLARSGVTPARLARAYRQEARVALTGVPWLARLDDDQRAWFREHGRRLASALLAHLDAAGDHPQHHQLQLATAEAAAYGRLTAALGVPLSEAVEGFLRFRRPFLHELALVARRRGFDTHASTELLEAAERAMDRLLVATMAAHSIARVDPPDDDAGDGGPAANDGTPPSPGA